MTPFQKLFWLVQMGISNFCDDKTHNLKTAISRQSDFQSLELLDKELEKQTFSLVKTASHIMTGFGKQSPKVMVVLESPTAIEDKTGKYLEGPEGELTQKMLSSIGLDIQSNTYLTYLSPWRPPGNRLLTAIEIQKCQMFLDQRIALIRPEFILLLGVPVIRGLLKNCTLSQIRQGHSQYMGVPILGTFAPGWLIKNPDYRRQVWEDLKKFKSLIGGMS